MNLAEIVMETETARTTVEMASPEGAELEEMTGMAQEDIYAESTSEQQKMESFSQEMEEVHSAEEAAEREEMLGYSSDYYEHKMSSALESGNKTAYNNAKKDWADAKAKEECK